MRRLVMQAASRLTAAIALAGVLDANERNDIRETVTIET